MTDINMIEKARQYCYKFKEIYGVFPENIGIHHKRSGLFDKCVELWDFNGYQRKFNAVSLEPLGSLAMQRHLVEFKPYVGIIWDDMILYHEKTKEVSLKTLDDYQSIMNIAYTNDSVSFHCVHCDTKLEIRKETSQSMLSAVFCQVCDEQYYMRWNDKLLTRGKIIPRESNDLEV